jgi:hypothetical protein
MNRDKILEKFSSKFKTKKRQELSEKELRARKDNYRSARRQRQNEEEEVWDSYQQRTP